MRADALLVVSALSFGTLAVLGKLGYSQGMNVQSLLGARFLLAGLCLSAAVVALRRRFPAPALIGALALMGALGYVGQSAAYFNSIRLVPAAVTSVLLYTYPAIVTVVSWPLFGARLTPMRLVALALSLAGVFLVASPHGGLRLDGVLLGLTSAVVYSTYILVGKRVMRDVDPLAAVAVVALSAGVAYLAFAGLTRTFTLPSTALAWVAVLALALFATAIGAGAFLAGLRLTDPARASLISTLEPVATAALAAIFLGELLGPSQLLGGVLVLIAVGLIARADAPGKRSQA